MMKSVILLLILLSFLGYKKGAEKESKLIVPEIRYELSGGAGHYNYAPSVIEDKYKTRYAFVCQNLIPFEIVDYLYLFKGIPTEHGYQWQPGTRIMDPSEEGWDHIHICDPDVREFTTKYNGETYYWIMTYLGVDQWHNHNQIGLAVSKSIEGPWIKFDKNPLITYADTTKWGVGQSTSVVIDSTTIRLFYSSTLKPKHRFVYRDIKLDNLDNIKLSDEKYILPGIGGNFYPAYSDNYIFIVSEERRSDDYEEGIPTWVGNYSTLRYISRRKGLSSPIEEWIEIGHVGPDQSGFPRNHNPGILTDSKGYMLNENELIMYFTPAVTGENWLWSYDLYSATFDISGLK